MAISKIFCSNFYTLFVNSRGDLALFGTLKGFAKFLFDSPNKDQPNFKRKSCLNLDLRGDSIAKVAIAERAFAVYSSDSHQLYFVDESFEPQCILRRELKSF